MKKKFFSRVKESSEVQAGSILIAKPKQRLKELYQSVILITDHNPEGTTGIILNKLTNLNLKDAFPELPVGGNVYYGGPTNHLTLSFIHPDKIFPASLDFGAGICWGGDYNYLMAMIAIGRINPSFIRFYAGIVFWKP